MTNSIWINLRLAPCSNIWVANACLRLCGCMFFLIPTLAVARLTILRTEAAE